MPYIDDQPIWEPVRLVESDDYVTGGIGGTANIAPTQLANRNAFLYEWLTRFTGIIVPFALSSAPSGWLECNGALIGRTAYAGLWTFAQGGGAIVTEVQWTANNGCFSTGDGSTTFRLPDLRGEFIRGWDNGRGVDAGRVIGSWQADMFKSHTHGYYLPTGAAAGTGTGNVMQPGTAQTTATGGVETRPRNVAYIFCVKY